MSYARPRPYWDDEKVDAVKCSKEFGNPSGHALITFSVYGYFMFYILKTKVENNLIKILVFVSAVILVGYDRVYLGVHYIWQVLLGWTYGFTVLVFAY